MRFSQLSLSQTPRAQTFRFEITALEIKAEMYGIYI